MILIATSEDEREAWLADIDFYSDPKIESDIEAADRKNREEKRRLLDEEKEKLKDLAVSEPVRVAVRYMSPFRNC